MFVEPISVNQGWIEVICGSMFSGKSEELIRRIKRAQIANQMVEIFKPAADTRYDDIEIVSHDTNRILSTPIQAAQEILLLTGEAEVVGIDEAQFFDNELVNVAVTLANSGKRIIIAGLDMDYLGQPFGPMPALLSVADFITKLHAICVVCGGIANFSYRKTNDDERVLLGEKEAYEPRCRNCYNKS